MPSASTLGITEDADINTEADIVLKRPDKLTKIRWLTREFPYANDGRPLLEDVLSIYEINRTYSISDVIDAIDNYTPEDVTNISNTNNEPKDWARIDTIFKYVLTDISNCRDPEFVAKAHVDAKYRTLTKAKATYNMNMLYMYGIDSEFVAIYLESLRLRNIHLDLTTIYPGKNKPDVILGDYFKANHIHTEGFKFTVDNHLILPELTSKKPIDRANIPFFTSHLGKAGYVNSVYSQSIVRTLGKGIAQTGNIISAIGNNITSVGKNIEAHAESQSIINNYYVTNNAFAMLNSAASMTQTKGTSGITFNKLHSELPESMGESVHILKKQFFRFAPALAGLSLAVAVLYGNSTFHEMQVTDTTPAMVKVMYSVNEAIYKKVPHFEPSVELSSSGEIKGILKMEPKSEPKLDSKPENTVILEKGSQIQKDFYQAIARFDINNEDSIKQLDTLSSNVETILNAQKTLGYRDLIVPEDILLNAKQKLATAHPVALNDTLNTH